VSLLHKLLFPHRLPHHLLKVALVTSASLATPPLHLTPLLLRAARLLLLRVPQIKLLPLVVKVQSVRIPAPVKTVIYPKVLPPRPLLAVS
jgi:hypothetical protein